MRLWMLRLPKSTPEPTRVRVPVPTRVRVLVLIPAPAPALAVPMAGGAAVAQIARLRGRCYVFWHSRCLHSEYSCYERVFV